jgi:hypothetical protein
MRWCSCEVDRVRVGSGFCFGVWGGSVVAAGLVCMCVVGFVGSAVAAGERCPNAALRVGPSANLPDCRAYELVTPADLGRTQDMTFSGDDHAIPSSDGEHLALEAVGTPLEPNPEASPSIKGTDAVFSRTSKGWTMKSATAPGTAADRIAMSLFSPDLSQVAFTSYTALNQAESEAPPSTVEVGPVGGPYAVAANLPHGEGGTSLLGANAGTASVPAFSHVLFESTDHTLLPPGAERTLAEETFAGAPDLYEWTDGALRLVNVEGEGSYAKLVNRCGATLGAGFVSFGAGAPGAVSDDGSKVFFTTKHSGEDCEGPPSLYMRVDDRETVEVSPLESAPPSERQKVLYNGASPDGSKVFFNTSTPLIAGETSSEPKLFMYDTVTRVLTRIPEVGTEAEGSGGNLVLVSEDGTTVYYETGDNIYRYDAQTGARIFVATIETPKIVAEPSYTTPSGEFLVFVAYGVEGEPRGVGHNELYRYDAVDRSVICVSCGEGVAPASGEVIQPTSVVHGVLETMDEIPPFVQMSENGQEVFFETTAQLVPQDTNSTETEIDSVPPGAGLRGMDVYEWEADGAGGCVLSQGCTYLLSSGEDQGPSFFLGASRDGSNVFFSSAAQLVPQATPEFTNIYDARIGGGFPPPTPVSECSSCQGVGSPPPLFSVPAGVSFTGAANPAVTVFESGPKTKTKTKKPKTQHGKRRRVKSRAATRRGVRAKARGKGRRS